MVKQYAEHIGLQIAPVHARSSRHRNEIAAKEDALHIAEGKKRVCQRRDFCFLWSREIARAGLHDLAAGKEFERRRIGRHFGFNEHEQYLGPIIRGIKGTSGSEEHTSELQSLMRISYAVFCLKKKKEKKIKRSHQQ